MTTERFAASQVSDWLAHLERLHPSEIELGLSRVHQVAERLQCLKPAPLTILVGGTNGKGTTSALLAQLLTVQGLNVGVYSSPHIQRYNERVAVNGEPISDADLISSFAAVEDARESTALTYFEFGTLAALWHFTQQSLDVCILEIGLGGRLDAVNIADADLSIVTSIGLDHQDWLGDTTELIAQEKCAIARADKPFICGQLQPPATAKPTVDEIGGYWFGRGEAFDVQWLQDALRVQFQQPLASRDNRLSVVSWDLPKPHIPYHNVVTAIQALALLELLPEESVVADVVANCSVSGRLQQIEMSTANGHKTLTLDVAHNEQAMRHLQHQCPHFDGVLFAALSDKPVEKVVAALPQHQQLWLAGLDFHRGLSAEALAARVDDAATNLVDDIQTFASVADALSALLALPSDQHWLIAGSFYTVEAALNFLEQGAQLHGYTPS